MQTECSNGQQVIKGLEKLGRREVFVDDSGGQETSDAGGLLLREVASSSGMLRRFAECFEDHRKPELTEHTVLELIGQRVFGVCLGYEDLNDHDRLRSDPLIAALVGKLDPEGKNRRRTADRGKALAGKSTLNRLELTPKNANAASRYKKVVYDEEALKAFFVEEFIRSQRQQPKEVVLDIDPTDDRVHGHQEGRYYHGYYGDYCYLPLYVFCGEELLWSELRTADKGASKGALPAVKLIVERLRRRFPKVRIVLRGDSDFSRDELMSWCEQHDVDFVFGLARNARLVKKLHKRLKTARRQYVKTGQSGRVYKSFGYRTHKTWSRSRRVVGKAEYLRKGPNPRFVVTSFGPQDYDSQSLYETLYCARGDMENRIKEQQLGLFADRTSSHTLRANQLRLWFASMAYVLMQTLRRVGLRGTPLARAQVWTLRERLLKVGAVISVSVRRFCVRLSSHHPLVPIWPKVLQQVAANYS
jgi:hypothetical protein